MVSADSHRVSRAPRYSGIGFESGPFSPTWLSHAMAPLSRGLRLTTGLVTLLLPTLQPLPHPRVQQVWAVPISLATTFGIETAQTCCTLGCGRGCRVGNSRVTNPVV